MLSAYSLSRTATPQVRDIRTPIFRTVLRIPAPHRRGCRLEGAYIRILGEVGSHRTRLRCGAPAEGVDLVHPLIPRQARDKRGVSNGSRERRASVDPAAPPVPVQRGAGPLSTRKRLGTCPLPIPFAVAGLRGRDNSSAPPGRQGATIRMDRQSPTRTRVRLRKQTALEIERTHRPPRGQFRQRRRLSHDRTRRRLGWGTSCDMRSWDLFA